MAMLVKVCLVILPDGYLQRALMSDIQFFSPGGYHRQFRQFYPDQNLAGAQLCLNNVQIVFFLPFLFDQTTTTSFETFKNLRTPISGFHQ